MRIDRRRLTSGICWFGATCLALTAFALALVSIEVRSGAPWSVGSLALIVLAAVSLFLMIALMAIGFRLDRPVAQRAPSRLHTNGAAPATMTSKTGE